MLHATETGISSSRVGLWLVCAFTYLTYLSPRGKNLTRYLCLAYDNKIPPIPQNGKKSEISFNKVSGNQDRKNNAKMHRSLYRQEKRRYHFSQVPESSSNYHPFVFSDVSILAECTNRAITACLMKSFLLWSKI